MSLIGRGSAEAQIQELIDAAAQGRSSVLVIRGEAGIGKTALLNIAVRHAGELTVLRTQCVETEVDFAFSALNDLLRPIIDLADRLPGPQRRALRVSLALDVDDAGPSSGVVTGLATLGILAEAAPALVVIDDMQWMDAASRTAVLFAARRLLGEGIVLLIAERPSDADSSGLPVLNLEGLDADAAQELVAGVCGSTPDHAQLDHLMLHSRGNPLALIELSQQDSQLSAGAAEAPPPPPEVIASAYRQRLAPLGADVAQALLICATSFTGETREIAAVLGEQGLQALNAAEDAGLLVIGDQVDFAHPLLRSTIYHDATPGRRRAAHQAIAETLADPARHNEDQRTWHAAAAALSPDADVADALARLGERSRARGALRASHAAYIRAAELTADDTTRATRAFSAAVAAQLAGDFTIAEAALDRATLCTVSPRLGAEIEQLRTQIRFTRSAPTEVFTAVSDMARKAAVDTPGVAATLWSTAAGIGAVAGLVREAKEAAEHARDVLPQSSPGLDVAVLQVHTQLLIGESGPAREVLVTAAEQLAGANPLDYGIEVFGFATMDLMWLDEHAAARNLLRQAISHTRRADALERLPSLLAVLADLELRLGRWNAAYTAAAECLTIADAVGQPLLVGYGASSMARVDAAQGNRERCIENVERTLAVLEPAGAELVTPYAHLALGQLHLSLGDYARAADQLLAVADRVRALGVANPVVFPYHPDLVEALFHTGRHNDAADVVASLAEQVDANATTSSCAMLARCRGLLASDEKVARDHFEDAIQAESTLGNHYAVARIRLLYGERLRRARRRALAHEQFTQARFAFDRLDARPWSWRVEGELQISTVRPEREPASLTNQEAQVARLAVEGLSNREAAATLFLSVKTIEYHLGNIYRKLGIRSRVELVRTLSTLEQSTSGS